MKLASLKSGRDGRLVVVSRDLRRAIEVGDIARTLQAAIDDWAACAPRLQAVSDKLNTGRMVGEFAFDQQQAHAPLPRAYQWVEGTVYLVHLERTRKSTNRELPQQLYTDPGVYQGVSNYFVPSHDPIPVVDDNWEIDFESSVAVITDDVPMGTRAREAASHIKLVVLLNDLSLRAVQIPEMKKGLGIVQGKPLKSFAPVAVTPQGLGKYWTGTMLARPVVSRVNGETVGTPEAHVDYNFDLPTLIEYVAKTRHIGAGSIISCGTVANRDESRGSSCMMEKRALEIIHKGKASTPFLKFGDRFSIECLEDDGTSIFGAMSHTVVKYDLAAQT